MKRLFATAALLVLTGCLVPAEEDEDASPTPTVPVETVRVTIADLQNVTSADHPLEGTHVLVANAVVTAVAQDEERARWARLVLTPAARRRVHEPGQEEQAQAARVPPRAAARSSRIRLHDSPC